MINHQTNELFFDNLQGAGARTSIGEEGQGFRYILDGMNAERMLHRRASASATPSGSSTRRVDYASERVVFGRPIGQNQGIQFPIARAYAQMRAAELMIREGCGAVRRRPAAPGEEANIAEAAGRRSGLGTRRRPACRRFGGFGFAE